MSIPPAAHYIRFPSQPHRLYIGLISICWLLFPCSDCGQGDGSAGGPRGLGHEAGGLGGASQLAQGDVHREAEDDGHHEQGGLDAVSVCRKCTSVHSPSLLYIIYNIRLTFTVFHNLDISIICRDVLVLISALDARNWNLLFSNSSYCWNLF